MPTDLFLHQEVMLLALNDAKGTPFTGMHTYAMAGAMLSELFLYERVVANDDKKRIVAVVNDDPIGEPLLDEFLEMVAESKKNRGSQYWIVKAAQIKQFHHKVAQSLCTKGILEQDERKILFMFTQKVYPELDGTFEDSIRSRMAEAMFNKEKPPAERTAVLIALASHADLLRHNFAPVELKQHKRRIKELAKGELLASNATKSAIDAVHAAAMSAAMIPIIASSS